MESIKKSFDEFYSHHARESLEELSELPFTITDPSLSNHPIIFASHAFLNITGFTRDEVLGRSGSMFQGPATCRRSVMEIREAVREEREANVVLVNYRKNGTPFWVFLSVCPVFCLKTGAVVHFVAVQVPLKLRVYGGGGSVVVNHDFMFRCCRKEVCSDSLVELDRVSSRNLEHDDDDVTGWFCFFVLFCFLCSSY